MRRRGRAKVRSALAGRHRPPDQGCLRQSQERDIGAGKPQGLMVEALEFDFSDDQPRVQEASPREAHRGHPRGGLGREEEAACQRESRQSSREVQEGLAEIEGALKDLHGAPSTR